jgi:Fe-S-cluster containining protein
MLLFTPMNEIIDNDFNSELAKSCQACQASCCRKGSVFLPTKEYTNIVDWLGKNSPDELGEFQSRSIKYADFYLYDQREACQFLDDRNLCRLHLEGVKPTECFWWPFHVYVDEANRLEIRLSTSCCDGYKHFRPNLPFISIIEEQARKFGADLIRAFRKVYKGSYDTKLVKKL